MRSHPLQAKLLSKERRINRCYPAALSKRSDHLTVSENPLVSFLALFAALFSIKVLSGFFLFCFLLSFFTHISRSLYLRLMAARKTTHRLSVFAALSTYTASLTTTAVFRLLPLPHGQG